MQPGSPMGLETNQEERTQAMLVWLLSIFTGFIAPLIFVLIAKDKKFVYFHAGQCITFMLFGVVLTVVTCGIGYVVLLAVAIIGAIKANGGEWWDVPVSGQLARNWFKL